MKDKPQTTLKSLGPRDGPWQMAITMIMLGTATLVADPPTVSTPMVINYATPSVSPGAEITLRATYNSGGLAPSFQWRFKGQDIAGANKTIHKLTSVGLADAGDYSLVVRNDDGETISPPMKLEVDPTFTLFNPLPALKSLNWMGAWADVNHDGWLDLVQTRDPGKHIALNSPDGTFVQIQEIPGTPGSEGNPAAFGDYDNDGFADLAVAEIWGNRVQIFHNDGTGHFVLVRQFQAIRPVMLTWVDIEGDGYLDLFQSSEGDSSMAEGGAERAVSQSPRRRHLHARQARGSWLGSGG